MNPVDYSDPQILFFFPLVAPDLNLGVFRENVKATFGWNSVKFDVHVNAPLRIICNNCDDP